MYKSANLVLYQLLRQWKKISAISTDVEMWQILNLNKNKCGDVMILIYKVFIRKYKI